MGNGVREHFDGMADNWDCLVSHPIDRIDHVLDRLGSLAGASVLDVGSGTGVLIAPLLGRVGPRGSVIAIDLSPRMVAIAKEKHSAPNLRFVAADFLTYEAAERVDGIVAYSCFPHFDDPAAFFGAAARNLSPGGRLLIAHIEGRASINAMHGMAAAAISRPLGPVVELASLAEGQGFEILYTEDSDEYYALYARYAV